MSQQSSLSESERDLVKLCGQSQADTGTSGENVGPGGTKRYAVKRGGIGIQQSDIPRCKSPITANKSYSVSRCETPPSAGRFLFHPPHGPGASSSLPNLHCGSPHVMGSPFHLQQQHQFVSKSHMQLPQQQHHQLQHQLQGQQQLHYQSQMQQVGRMSTTQSPLIRQLLSNDNGGEVLKDDGAKWQLQSAMGCLDNVVMMNNADGDKKA